MRGVGRHTVRVKGREKRERDEVASAEPSFGRAHARVELRRREL
jgi:hypothetical protein